MKSEFLITRQGKQHVLYAGLLDAAHALGLKAIETELLRCEIENGEPIYAVAKATVTMEDGRVFQGIGDATRKNVAKNISGHLIRMSETRAKARALRDAVNIGATALEELGDDEVTPSSPSPQEKDKLLATRKQLNYLEALAEDALGGGIARFEEIAGKALSELTRGEASEWVSRLSGKVPAHEPTNEVHHQPSVEPPHEDAANEEVEEAEVVGQPEHALVLTELQRIYYRIPKEKRPDEATVFDYAERGLKQARERLKWMRFLAAEAGMLPEEDEDEEIVREYVEESVPSGPHPEQEEVIAELAEKLYGNESKMMSGVEWLEETMLKRPIATLSKSEAKQLIDTVRDDLKKG